MELPFEYPFSNIIKLSKTIEKEKIINNYLINNTLKNISLEYSRTESNNPLGGTLVKFEFYVNSTNNDGLTKQILILSNRIGDRGSLYDLIDYLELLSKKYNVDLINKFHNDGYSYDRIEIKRILTNNT